MDRHKKTCSAKKGYEMASKKVFGALVFICVTLFLFVAAIYSAEQYKQQNREAISQIVDGKHDKAIRHFENYLKKHPNDLESMYGLTVAYAQKKDIGKAVAYAKQAVDAGLPFSRFLAGPRDLLMPLTDSAEFKQLAKKHTVELLHGPMLGCVTDSTAKFWVRTANEVPVQVLVSSSQNTSSPIKSSVTKTNKNRDFTIVIAVQGLKPDTRYYYELLVNGRKQPKRWSFRTFPARAMKTKFQIGFGGGAGYTPQYERMWNTIVAQKPLAFLFLGDNVYIDNPTRPDVQRYCYYRRQSRPEFRNLVASSAVYAIWDDHDFTTNDGWGGPEINEPAWKIPVRRLFRNNWNNPYYGGGENQPGCWFDFSIGDVDFFMLDSRYYRNKPKRKNPSMLGPVQKEWLLKKLKSSTATFKVLASPVSWAFGTKPGSLDTWEGYKKEREDIFSCLEDNRIDGVILLSADRHRSDIWKIDRSNGYDLYEFESSKLTNIHTHRLIPAALFGYNEKCSFGLLSFDTGLSDPQVTYQIISIDNEVIHTFSLLKSQLTHKKANNGS
jgi:alkaline phosphatase D